MPLPSDACRDVCVFSLNVGEEAVGGLLGELKNTTKFIETIENFTSLAVYKVTNTTVHTANTTEVNAPVGGHVPISGTVGHGEEGICLDLLIVRRHPYR